MEVRVATVKGLVSIYYEGEQTMVYVNPGEEIEIDGPNVYFTIDGHRYLTLDYPEAVRRFSVPKDS